MPDLKNVKEYIRALEHITHFFRTLLDEEKRVTPAPDTEEERLSELTDLRLMTRSEIWPDAIDIDLIGGEETVEEKQERAVNIITDFIGEDLNGKRFLDYGCGEGYVARNAVDFGASYAIGYDIQPRPSWDSLPSIHAQFALTTNLTDNEFDIILLNDVLDHCADPLQTLLHAKISKKIDGRIHVRCHPWTSRHGTHLYKKVNKAYLQLVFTEAEQIGMGLLGEKVFKPLDPVAAYKKMFADLELTIIRESYITQPVEAFFTTRPAIVRRIKENWKNSLDPELAAGTKYPHEIMEVQFADFVLI